MQACLTWAAHFTMWALSNMFTIWNKSAWADLILLNLSCLKLMWNIYIQILFCAMEILVYLTTAPWSFAAFLAQPTPFFNPQRLLPLGCFNLHQITTKCDWFLRNFPWGQWFSGMIHFVYSVIWWWIDFAMRFDFCLKLCDFLDLQVDKCLLVLPDLVRFLMHMLDFFILSINLNVLFSVVFSTLC